MKRAALGIGTTLLVLGMAGLLGGLGWLLLAAALLFSWHMAHSGER